MIVSGRFFNCAGRASLLITRAMWLASRAGMWTHPSPFHERPYGLNAAENII